MQKYIGTLILLLLSSTVLGQTSGKTDFKSTRVEEDSALRMLHSIFQIEKQVDKNETILADLERQKKAVRVISRDVQRGLKSLSNIKDDLPQFRSERNRLRQQFSAIEVPAEGLRDDESERPTPVPGQPGSPFPGGLDGSPIPIPPGNPNPPIPGPPPPMPDPLAGVSDVSALAVGPIVTAYLIAPQDANTAAGAPADSKATADAPQKDKPGPSEPPKGGAARDGIDKVAEPTNIASQTASKSKQPSIDKLRGMLSEAQDLQSRVVAATDKLDEASSSFRSSMIALAYLARGRTQFLEVGRPEAGWEDDFSKVGSAAYFYVLIDSELRSIDYGINRLEDAYEEAEILGLAVEEDIATLLSEMSEEEARTTGHQLRLQEDLRLAYERATERKGIDDYLSYAIIAMIVAMVLLYVSLMAFGERLAETIVSERVLLELLSMGFLLLTVIILGTGKLLTIESLAALLGTIAGYIFGQKTSGADEEA